MMYRFILVSFLLFKCSSTEKVSRDFTGIYVAPQNNFFNRLRYGSFTLDMQLELRTDSTYFLSSCAQYFYGTWKVKERRLFLHLDSARFIIDSLNYLPEYKSSFNRKFTDEYKIDGSTFFQQNNITMFILLKK